MKNATKLLLFTLLIAVFAACGNEEKSEGKEQTTPDLVPLEVEFIVPETADVGETVLLKAIVTQGEEAVKDADEVEFEYWEVGKEDVKTKVESTNHGDGSYTSEVTFDRDGVFEMYAHTTANGMHTMPKLSITIGEGASAATEEEHQEHGEGHGHEHGHGHSEDFGMHFVKPENVKTNQNIQLSVHPQLNNEPLTDASIRYEIYKEGVEKHDWVDTEESTPGEYTATHSFKEDGKYTIVIHVTNDSGLHEHEEHVVEVK